MTKRYADNAANRRLGRVGMTIGGIFRQRTYGLKSWRSSVKVYKSSPKKPRVKKDNYNKSSFSRSYSNKKGGTRFYADNATNRRLGRDGMPVGDVFRESSYGEYRIAREISLKSYKSKSIRTYKDTPKNRKLGRVGCLY